jgi:hypothetical protein
MSQRVRSVSQDDASSLIFAYLISFLGFVPMIGTKPSTQFYNFKSSEVRMKHVLFQF